MKQRVFTNLTVAVFLMLAAVAVFAQQPKTVTDFYLALPDDRYSHPFGREIKSRAEITKYRKSLITIEDIKNGYLKLENNESEGWSEFALFKKSDGAYLFAVSEIGCGPGCSGELQLLTFKNGKWTDVSERFSPEIPTEADLDLESYWKLPRVGKTLIFVNTNESVRDESEKLIYKEFKFEWDGAKFVKK
jgi:hypothetical protein